MINVDVAIAIKYLDQQTDFLVYVVCKFYIIFTQRGMMPSKVDKANLPNLVLVGLIHNQVTSCLVILILLKCLKIVDG